jgi:hypothetical protein
MSIEKIVGEFSLINQEIIRYLEARLHEWAIWNLKKDNPGLKYPSETIEYRFMTMGIIPSDKYKGPKPLPVHDRAEEMEAIVRIMAMQGGQARDYATALREYYIGKGRGSKEKAAEIMGISKWIFRRHIKGAVVWLKGWFSGYYGAHIMRWPGS